MHLQGAQELQGLRQPLTQPRGGAKQLAELLGFGSGSFQGAFCGGYDPWDFLKAPSMGPGLRSRALKYGPLLRRRFARMLQCVYQDLLWK